MNQIPPKLTAQTLTAHMCARLCHDLSAPITGLSSAIEVLEDHTTAELKAEALTMMKNSSQQLIAKLRYLRLAFGSNSTSSERFILSDLQALTSQAFVNERINIIWQNPQAELNHHHTRLLLNFILVLLPVLCYGGTLTIDTFSTPEKPSWSLKADAKRLKFDPDLIRILSGQTTQEAFSGYNIQPFFTGMILRETGAQFSIDHDEVQLVCKISLPTA